MYNLESDPSFYRQAYYHSTLAGNKSELSIYHLPEITSCADSWYQSKNYIDSLWAYKIIQEKRNLHPKEQMKMSSCLIRTKDDVKEGIKLYHDLIRRYKTWKGVKSSYIDSLLFIGGHTQSAMNMLFKISERERDYYWHRQAAKCYRQLSKRKDAYKEYEEAILQSAPQIVWHVIHELVVYAREVGDDDTEAEWLKYAWNYLNIRSNELKINLGAYFERIDKLIDSEELLREVHQNDPYNAFCILSLVKTLCKGNKIDDAKIVLENILPNTSPEDVLVYAKIIYLKTLGQFSECEKLLLSLSMSATSRTSVHRWGQWADLFLSWSHTLKGKDKIDVAYRGLKFVKQIMKERNVPAMMACLELSKIIDNGELQVELQNTIHEVNNSYFQ